MLYNTDNLTTYSFDLECLYHEADCATNMYPFLEEYYNKWKADCKLLDQYLSENQKQLFCLIGSQEACEYISFLSSKCAPRTVKRKVCTLRKLLEWCKENSYLPAEIKIDISENIVPPEREFAKTEEIALLFKSCCHIFEEDEYVMARAKMVTLLIVLCGFKISELTDMKLSDISEEGTIKFTDDLRRKRVKRFLVAKKSKVLLFYIFTFPFLGTRKSRHTFFFSVCTFMQYPHFLFSVVIFVHFWTSFFCWNFMELPTYSFPLTAAISLLLPCFYMRALI